MSQARRRIRQAFGAVIAIAAIVGITFVVLDRLTGTAARPRLKPGSNPKVALVYQPHQPLDISGFGLVMNGARSWGGDASLETVRQSFLSVFGEGIAKVDRDLASAKTSDNARITLRITRALILNSEGEAERAYAELDAARRLIERNDRIASTGLYSLIYMQGVTALRRGENDNCVMCRGESSCILPIAAAAIHAKPEGSRQAIAHFTEYLERFPDDLDARWLLNIAHMTLGEYPGRVNPRYLVSLKRFETSEFDIGKFRDIGHLAGVNKFNESGGAIMDDFDGDGRLDIVVTSFSQTEPMALFHNKGDGTFEDRSESAGLAGQYGGLVCYQTDYNNDGLLDIHIPRGAWFKLPVRPSLLRNNGNGSFTDVTQEAGLLDPVNSNAACWADFDNDGFLDVFIACEKQTNRLYRNRGNGTFEEVAAKAGVAEDETRFGKGATWIDYDNDDYPDLFINHLNYRATLYHNNRNGTFTETTLPMGVSDPSHGFACWAWDYDNDGWLDLFATCYDRTLKGVVKSLIGQPSGLPPSRLFRNDRGKQFLDTTVEAGLDQVFAAMGSNFADFDNDGFLDFYLGTGDPDIATLVPNRMFKGVDGKRFAEITASSRTGHLQKGHGVACGDWDRDGDTDLFVQMGGAIKGDRYHDVLFQNPGQGNNHLTVKLIGKKTNRAAIGARIKVVTAGAAPMTIHRHISSGSSFGANPLQQTIGLARAEKVATLEIHWPTSRTTQILHDIPANRSIEITESEPGYRTLDSSPIPCPE
jgi:hypothetical protein